MANIYIEPVINGEITTLKFYAIKCADAFVQVNNKQYHKSVAEDVEVNKNIILYAKTHFNLLEKQSDSEIMTDEYNRLEALIYINNNNIKERKLNVLKLNKMLQLVLAHKPSSKKYDEILRFMERKLLEELNSFTQKWAFFEEANTFLSNTIDKLEVNTIRQIKISYLNQVITDANKFLDKVVPKKELEKNWLEDFIKNM